MVYRYQAIVEGRDYGALGKFYPITITFTSSLELQSPTSRRNAAIIAAHQFRKEVLYVNEVRQSDT